ncbi:hypothetical protein [Kitasatospora sp. NPDC089509]|uniref:hypothetical protein n=1 Tax=Kitasatospora sp. NPDC089509 TaxID=3364079 RepID=UPI00382075A2
MGGTRAAPDPRLRSLMRRRLRTALLGTGWLVLLLGSLPLLLELSPAAADFRIAGIRLAWLLLGVLAYPVLWLMGRWYVRRVERDEAAERTGART